MRVASFSIQRSALALILIIALLLPALPTTVVAVVTEESENTLYISTAQQFLEFAELCRYDAYSQDLTVVLTTHIDLTGLDFEDIPIFLGTFDGGGYTISGVDRDLHKDGQGLFRLVAAGAVVSNLTVSGACQTVYNRIGGIAAENNGTIQNCHYRGVVSGLDAVGGIAGENNGTIYNCTVSGGVFGETQVGGVAGTNQGTILRCSNYAEVNTNLEEFTFTTGEKLVDNINPTSDTIDIADVGGIAGSSEGILQNCINCGAVGYPHVGYNIGGIVGRQSGYVADCTNMALVQGRKEVGGIAGQFEPFVDNLYSISKLQELRDEISVLSNLTTVLNTDAKAANTLISSDFTQLGTSVDESKLQVESLLEQTEAMINANVDEANRLSVTVANTLDALVPITDSVDVITADLSESITHFKEMAVSFRSASEALEGVGPVIDQVLIETELAGDSLEDSVVHIQAAITLLQEGENLDYLLEDLEAMAGYLEDAAVDLQEVNYRIGNAVTIIADFIEDVDDDFAAAAVEFAGVRTSLNQISTGLTGVSSGLSTLTTGLSSVLSGDTSGIVQGLSSMASSAQTIATGFSGAVSGLWATLDELETLRTIGTVSNRVSIQLDYAGESMDDALGLMEKAMDRAGDAVGELAAIKATVDSCFDELIAAGDDLIAAKGYMSQAVEAGKELEEIFGTANDALQSGLTSLADGFTGLDKTIQSLETTAGMLSDLVEDLSNEEEIVFTKFDETYDDTREALSQALTQVGDDLEQINTSITSKLDLLIDDVQAINLQLTKVLDLVLEMMQDVTSFTEDETYLIEDISTWDTSEVYAGKMTGCENTGTIEGDINVGGLVGAISFELSFDMEDDWKTDRDKTQTITRQGLAVVEDSINLGEVVAKKDGAGGIVGYQDFGLVQNCTAVANVESTEGNYVGGIAGQSAGYIRSCFAKTTLSGAQFVGGIAGSAYDVQGCYALSSLTATKGGSGGIVGELDTQGTLRSNYFINEILGGLDGISFAGQAESISYEELLLVEGLPEQFQSMTLRFFVGDTFVDSREVAFGAELSQEDYPSIPVKEGYYSRWEELDTSTITSDLKIEGNYFLRLTTLGNDKNEEGISTVLVDGSFTDQEHLIVTQEPSSEEGTVEYRLWVEGEATAITAVRCLAPEDGVTVQHQVDGQWVELEATLDGKYLVIPLEAEGVVQLRTVVEEEGYTLQIIEITLGIALVGLVLWNVVAKKRKGKKALSTEATKESVS